MTLTLLGQILEHLLHYCVIKTTLIVTSLKCTCLSQRSYIVASEQLFCIAVKHLL